MLISELSLNQVAGLQRMSSPKPVQVISVTSGKGGVGKTNASANIAISLASQGKDVLLLDADFGLANIDVLLGIQATNNLSHVINGERTLEEIMVRGPGGIRIIPASSGVKDMVGLNHAEHAGVIRAFSELSFNPDVLLIDTAAGITDSVVTFIKASHEVIVVVCDEPASITDAYAMIKLLSREHGMHRFRILANMVNSAQEGIELYKNLVKVTDQFLDVALSYIGAVPYDDYLKKAIKKQKAVVDAYPRSKSAISFKKIAQKTSHWPVPKLASGGIEFFVEKLFKNSNEIVATEYA